MQHLALIERLLRIRSVYPSPCISHSVALTACIALPPYLNMALNMALRRRQLALLALLLVLNPVVGKFHRGGGMTPALAEILVQHEDINNGGGIPEAVSIYPPYDPAEPAIILTNSTNWTNDTSSNSLVPPTSDLSSSDSDLSSSDNNIAPPPSKRWAELANHADITQKGIPLLSPPALLQRKLKEANMITHRHVR